MAERLDRGPGERLFVAQPDAVEGFPDQAVDLHEGLDPVQDVPVEPLPEVQAETFVQQLGGEPHCEPETPHPAHGVEQGHRQSPAARTVSRTL